MKRARKENEETPRRVPFTGTVDALKIVAAQQCDLVTKHLLARTCKRLYVALCQHKMCTPEKFFNALLWGGYTDLMCRWYRWVHHGDHAMFFLMDNRPAHFYTPDFFQWLVEHTPCWFPQRWQSPENERICCYIRNELALPSAEEAMQLVERVRDRYGTTRPPQPRKWQGLARVMEDRTILIADVWSYMEEHFLDTVDMHMVARTCRSAYVSCVQHRLCKPKRFIRTCVNSDHVEHLNKLPPQAFDAIFKRSLRGVVPARWYPWQASMDTVMHLFQDMEKHHPELFHGYLSMDCDVTEAITNLRAVLEGRFPRILDRFPMLVKWNLAAYDEYTTPDTVLRNFMSRAAEMAIRHIFTVVRPIHCMLPEERHALIRTFSYLVFHRADAILNSVPYTAKYRALYQSLPTECQQEILVAWDTVMRNQLHQALSSVTPLE